MREIFILILNIFLIEIWDKAFKNGPNKIWGRQPLKNLKGYPFKSFKGWLPQTLLGPFLNTLSCIVLQQITVDFKKENTVPGNRSYADVAMSRNVKNSITKKVIVFGDSIIRGVRMRDFNQQLKKSSNLFLVVIVRKCFTILNQH